MNKVSKKEKHRQELYAARRVVDISEGLDSSCKRCGASGVQLQRHHPEGRNDILKYFYLCVMCHDWCHSSPKEARLEGYLK